MPDASLGSRNTITEHPGAYCHSVSILLRNACVCGICQNSAYDKGGIQSNASWIIRLNQPYKLLVFFIGNFSTRHNLTFSIPSSINKTHNNDKNNDHVLTAYKTPDTMWYYVTHLTYIFSLNLHNTLPSPELVVSPHTRMPVFIYKLVVTKPKLKAKRPESTALEINGYVTWKCSYFFPSNSFTFIRWTLCERSQCASHIITL